MHTAFEADPIGRLEAEASVVEPIWDDEALEQEAEEAAVSRADDVTAPLDVAAELDPEGMTMPFDAAAELDPESMTVPLSMAGATGDADDAPADADEPKHLDEDATEDAAEADAESEAESEAEADADAEDADQSPAAEEQLGETQLIASEDLPADTHKGVDDAPEQPEPDPADQVSPTSEQEVPAEPQERAERRSVREEPQVEGPVPEFLAAGRMPAGQAGGEVPWDDVGTVQGRYVLNPWEGRRRASERQRSRVPMALVAGVVCGAMVVTLFLAWGLLFGGRAENAQQEGSPAISSKVVSADEAAEVIASLNGWWKTDRTFDGRYWHLTDGLMEVYAADGKIASQVLLDGSSIEHMSAGPGGIEGAGYYLRDIAFYLTDDDPDTLYAIDIDGTADEDANLLRSDAPPFMGGAQTETAPVSQPQEPADASEYILPESSTRVYEAWELEGLSDHDLFIARNEIYARHGYVFEGGELSEYFASKSWYLASDVFNEADITEIERQNVSLILSVEQQRGSSYV